MTVAFISDLHLDAARPEATAALLEFLRGPALDLQKLFILGDLFEYWVGDDDPNPHNRNVAEALQCYTQRQPRTYFMPGNRDFLIGVKFMHATGLLPLADPSVIEIEGKPVLLSHGDIFCTDDVAYQRFRRISRNPLVMMAYRCLPFSWRQGIVDKARHESRAQKTQKSAQIMDVNQQAVTQAMQRLNVSTLLHGHTHRPAEHRFDLHGAAATRIVLGDWYKDGPILYWDANGRRTETLSFQP